MGNIIPLTWYEALPGDTIQHSVSALVRCAPMVTPVMHSIDVRIHCFFVPNRLLWPKTSDADGWEAYITGGPDGLDAQAHPTIFTVNLDGNVGNNAGVGTLADFMGVPTANLGDSLAINALPFRAYNMIWNEWYRDEQLQPVLDIGTGAGDDNTTVTSLQSISWEKDYLTTTRTNPSLGATLGVFPTGAQAPVAGLGVVDGTAISTSPAGFRDAAGNTGATPGVQSTTAGVWIASEDPGGAFGAGNPVGVAAQLSGFDGGSINDLRRQFALQRYQEARNMWGSRYVEYLAYHGVRASDARLQRPELLSSSRSVMQISEVLQTGGDSAGAQTGVGTMAGHGISGLRTNRYRKFYEEHGIVMCMMSVRPRSVYMQRTTRNLLRGTTQPGLTGTKEDYWQRELEQIGMQGVNTREIDSSVANGVWGFQDRYDEYRRMESSVHGQFRDTLSNWHLARDFGSPPSLNQTFTTCTPTTRVFADEANDNVYVLSNHSVQARRLLRKTSNPRVL